MEEFPEFQHKPEKKKNYKERIASGQQKRWNSGNKSSLKKSKLRKVSKKYKVKLDSYKEKKNNYLIENSSCEICGTCYDLSIHHKMGRGEHVDNEEYFMTLCLSSDYLNKLFPDANHSHSGGCHGFVEANKEWARQEGHILY